MCFFARLLRVETGSRLLPRRSTGRRTWFVRALLGGALAAFLTPQTHADTGTFSEVGIAVSNAYVFLRDQMDQYHRVFYIYKDRNAGGNCFVPGGWMGDYGDIGFEEGWTNNPAEGSSCLRLTYSADQAQSNGWAGIYWLSIDKNWGDKGPGYDLTGATRLRFSARGEYGGEKAVFKVGGVNWPSFHEVEYPYMDSCEPVALGPVTLGADWTQYEIDLATPERFRVYSDAGAAGNHFVPSAWYNGSGNMWMDEACTESPHSGETCVKITWDGLAGDDGWKWNGVGWEWPEGRILPDPPVATQGFNLAGASNLHFWVRVDEPDVSLKFIFGHETDSCDEVNIPGGDIQGYVPVPTSWTQMTIPVPPGTSMTNVTIGFAVFFNDEHPPGTDGFSIYLDDIEFDRPLQKNLESVIGGFCWVTDTNMNPGGCTIYLDDIQLDKPRLDRPRFLQSYVTLNGADEYILNNQATTYDNALALMAFTLEGATDSLHRAGLIADAFMLAVTNDRDFADGRVRNVYRSGDVLDEFNGEALLAGWWDTNEQAWVEDTDAIASKVGDAAWAALALLQYARVAGSSNAFATAKGIGNWIVSNTWSDSGPGGFSGGYWGWPDGEEDVDWGWYTWKSTEHNLDAWRLFAVLHEETGETRWQDAAEHARGFVESMWNSGDGMFHTGTEDDGATVNTNLLALDPNSWGVLAFWTNLETYVEALAWAEANCLTNCAGFRGFDFNNDRDGVWFEGTAQMALAFLYAGFGGRAEQYLREIRRAQTEALNAEGRGIVAACKDGLSTGLGWQYNARLHVGATSWYLFGEYGFNPFRDAILPRIRAIDASGEGVCLTWTGSASHTCAVEWCEDITGSWTNREVVTVSPWETRWLDGGIPADKRFYRLAVSK